MFIYLPPAFPNSASLYGGAWTSSRYRSLPHLYRHRPFSVNLMSSNLRSFDCCIFTYRHFQDMQRAPIKIICNRWIRSGCTHICKVRHIACGITNVTNWVSLWFGPINPNTTYPLKWSFTCNQRFYCFIFHLYITPSTDSFLHPDTALHRHQSYR